MCLWTTVHVDAAVQSQFLGSELHTPFPPLLPFHFWTPKKEQGPAGGLSALVCASVLFNNLETEG
jgi:hypothetical protein